MSWAPFIPLADFEDGLKIVVTIAFTVLYLLSQFISGRDELRRRGRAKPKPRPKPPVKAGDAAPAGGPKQPSLEDSLRREVDEFLRKAQGKPAEEKPKPLRERPSQTIPDRPVPIGQQRRETRQRRETEQQQREAARKKSQRSSKKLPTEERSNEPRRLSRPLREASVSEHVAEHIDSRALAQHAERLGDEVALADDKMDEHLHQVFDHKLGSLARQASPTEKKAKSPTAAEQVLELLSRPGGVQQVIIANEILRRPEL